MEKKCIKCNETKDINEFVKDKNKKDGHRNICKKCKNLNARKTPIKPIPKEGYKYCSKCNKELPFESFNKYQGKYYSSCKICEGQKDKNKYFHKCIKCGKEYKSGNKNSVMCQECSYVAFGEQGKKNLKILNYNQRGKNNRMYGVHRFGEKNPNYNPDKTDIEREQGRLLEGYAPWRNEVYNRDNYTCQCCGDSKGGNLNAHHLDGYSWCREKRTDINNGITLCNVCHNEFHNIYGYGNNTERQYEEFLKKKSMKEA